MKFEGEDELEDIGMLSKTLHCSKRIERTINFWHDLSSKWSTAGKMTSDLAQKGNCILLSAAFFSVLVLDGKCKLIEK